MTRDDVARLAGTSTAVVSYVINNGPRPVAPATRERVLAAIKELGYRPDRVAQAMASRRTDLIGLIVPDARQPFFAEMAHAVEQAAAERGKMVLVGNSDYLDEREVHYLRAFLGMRVSGLILISQGPSEHAAAEIDAWDARVVLLHRAAGGHRRRRGRDRRRRRRPARHPAPAGARPPVRRLPRRHRRRPRQSGDPVTDHVEGWRRAMQEAGQVRRGPALPGPVQPLRRLPGRAGAARRARTGRRPSSARRTTRRSACCGPPASCGSTCRASWRSPASTT